MAATATPPRTLTYATAREALEAALGCDVPARAELVTRPLFGFLAEHHVDGAPAYEAEQVAGAVGDAHLAAAGATMPGVVACSTIVRHPHLAGELARIAGRPDSAVVVAGAWTI